ncbi:dexamethasone-induced protein isoform X1 [Apodemus sylvaticus]|uniref:dexamethasone-induced protein isoform X1 n=1 Tax=Apodemus sylvaticus TaxID=10129 RepID=UPI00224261DC|nr:dexamethasone-induced protein isoform X1 [Apodemus sylvaticus]
MPLPLVGGTIWTGMRPQEEAWVMKICLVERTKTWTSLHGNWSMNINHCYRQLTGRWPPATQSASSNRDPRCLQSRASHAFGACSCQQPGSCPKPSVCLPGEVRTQRQHRELPGPLKASPATWLCTVLDLACDSPPL